MNDGLTPQDFRILVVDDDKNITRVAELYLKHHGFAVTCAYDGETALQVVDSGRVHLVVLDVMMPDLDGWEVCQRIREQRDIPVLMVTARGDATDKLQGFALGADDYLVKPFDPNELVARSVALLRRTYRPQAHLMPTATRRFGTLTIDANAHTATVDGSAVELTPREYQLLRMFAEHPDQVLNRQQLLDFVWGMDYVGEDRVVDVFVKRLRQKLGRGDGWALVTVRGEGYKFQARS